MHNIRFSQQQAALGRWGVQGVLFAVLLGSGVWGMREAIAPQVAQADTSRLTLTLQREPEESFPTMVRRAESVARAAVQRSFDSDILVTDVVVTIVGENRGLAAPILEIQVSRADWRSRPDPQRWATYFRTARVLLEMDGTTAPAQQPADIGQPEPAVYPAPAVQPVGVDPTVIPPPIPLPQEVPGNPVIPQAVSP